MAPPTSDKPSMLKIKGIFVGDPGVGKSCLVLQFTDRRFRPCHEVTVGVEFGYRVFDVEGQRIKLHLWDTCGQETFKSITRSFFRGAALAFVVYDITDSRSVDHVKLWREEVRQYGGPGIPCFLVGNKVDLAPEKRVISHLEGARLAEELGCAGFAETSALDAASVEACVLAAIRMLLRSLPACPDEAGELPNGISLQPLSRASSGMDRYGACDVQLPRCCTH